MSHLAESIRQSELDERNDANTRDAERAVEIDEDELLRTMKVKDLHEVLSGDDAIWSCLLPLVIRGDAETFGAAVIAAIYAYCNRCAMRGNDFDVSNLMHAEADAVRAVLMRAVQ